MSQDDAFDDSLYQDPRLVQFYDHENGWGPDFEYCLRLADDARSVLDLGCGTGELAAGMATHSGSGRTVFGVDPAAAMLDVARRRPGGERVTWIQSDAQSLRLERQFDLVVLTGHAFQVFLTDDDQRAVLSTIARHLSPPGRFIFDTRNPAAQAWLGWAPEHSRRRVEIADLGEFDAWNEAKYDATTGIVEYRTHYQPADGGPPISASSKIRFTSREMLAAMLDEADLIVDEWLGDWKGCAWQSDSREIIPVGHLRRPCH